MKRLLPITLSLMLCHCGTEVGNGVAPSGDTGKATSGASTGSADPTSAPKQDSTTAPEAASYVMSTSLIAACASPFAETIEGTFTNSKSQAVFKVSPNNSGQKLVTRSDGSLIYTITPAPDVGPYAIQALPIAPNVTCGAVSSTTLADSSVQRSVTLSSGDQVRWILKGGSVTTLSVTTATQSEEIWTRTNP